MGEERGADPPCGGEGLRREDGAADGGPPGDPLTLQQLRQELRALREDFRQSLGEAASRDARGEVLCRDVTPAVVPAVSGDAQAVMGDRIADIVPEETARGLMHFRSELHGRSSPNRATASPFEDGGREVFSSYGRYNGFSVLGVGNDDLQALSASRRPQVAAKYDSAKQLEGVMGVIVVLNTALIAYQAHLEIENPGGLSTPTLLLVERLFWLAFLTEIMARLLAQPRGFFVGDRHWWNLFDSSLVLLQASEAFLKHWHVADMGTLRILRLVRLTRMIRLFATFDQLSAIVEALSSTLNSLVWTMILVFMIMIAASICTLHGIVHFEKREYEHVVLWFGGMGRTMLTLFECITGGVSWDEVARPLFDEVSPVIGILLCLYIIVGVIVMMNLVTGIFVEQVIQSEVENRSKLMAQRMTDHLIDDGDGILTEDEMNNVITKDVFVEKMQHHTMQDYLKAIDVPSASTPELFDLFDVDGNGAVDREEIVNGCLSFRGNAKGLDVQVMLRAIGELQRTLSVPQPITRASRQPPRASVSTSMLHPLRGNPGD